MGGDGVTWARPELDAMQTDQACPPAADVVVIGAGIVGVSTAMFLAERGVRVVVCEKGAPGAEQSGRNWGWVRNMGRALQEIPLMLEALRIWDGLSNELGPSLGFRRAGLAYLCKDENELARRAKWLARARGFDLDTRVIGPEEVGQIMPGSAARWAGALYAPSDGRAEPQAVVPALVTRARALGAAVVAGCAVRGVETKAGRIASVLTELGEIACGAVVVAAGAWSRTFCSSLGLDLPQLKVLTSVMRVDGVEGPETAALGSNFAFRRRADGGYSVANGVASVVDITPDAFRLFRHFLPIFRASFSSTRLRLGPAEAWLQPAGFDVTRVTPFERTRILDPKADAGHLAEARANLAAAFPAFALGRVTHMWGGYIDVTPDAVPVISAVPDHPGLFVATGFSGHGFGLGPGAGRLMADLVVGERPIVDPTPFEWSRFAAPSPRPSGSLAG
jgi:glycine/D-amino acid oxidase-like deaminating enzyme